MVCLTSSFHCIAGYILLALRLVGVDVDVCLEDGWKVIFPSFFFIASVSLCEFLRFVIHFHRPWQYKVLVFYFHLFFSWFCLHPFFTQLISLALAFCMLRMVCFRASCFFVLFLFPQLTALCFAYYFKPPRFSIQSENSNTNTQFATAFCLRFLLCPIATAASLEPVTEILIFQLPY